MACNIPYLDKQPYSETEKERLKGKHVDAFDLAKASGAFRVSGDKLIAKKYGFAQATTAVAKINKRAGANIASLKKVKSTGNTEQFALNVDVTPLSNENQGEIFKMAVATERLADSNPNLLKYVPDSNSTAKPILERLLADEGNTETRKGLQVMLDNVDKIKTPIRHAPTYGDTAATYSVWVDFDTNAVMSEITIDPTIPGEASQIRRYLTHELHHAFGIGVLRDPSTDNERNFARNIKRVYLELLNNNKEVAKDIYGLTNVYEFIAELASNPEFRGQLRGTSLWSRILRAFRKLLGMTDSYDRILDDYYKVLDEVQYPTRFRGRMKLDVKTDKKKSQEEIKTKKRLDALEQMLNALRQRAKRFAHQGKGRARQQTESNIVILEELMKNKRNEATIQSLLVIERETQELSKQLELLSRDPSKINPDILREIGVQLTSYEVLNSFYSDIRRAPLEFVGSAESVPVFLKQLDELRAKIKLMTEDVKDLNKQRFAWVISQRNTDPNKNYNTILDNLDVADRDLTFWNRMAESPRGLSDEAVVAVHGMLDDTYAKSHRDTLTDDIYRKDPIRDTAYYATPKQFGEFHVTEIDFTSVGIIKAEEDFENWMKTQGKDPNSLADKASYIINTETLKANANGVKFISPLSQEGKAILSIKPTDSRYPLKQYYETIVLGYLKKQERIQNPAMRPGLRIPTISRGMFEGILRETGFNKLRAFKEDFVKTVRRRYDDKDFRAVDENMQPISYLPLRYVAKQDGNDGRMTTREVSLDVASTVALFSEEMRTRDGMLKIMSDLEIGRDVLGERKVAKATSRVDMPGIGNLLTRQRVARHDPNTGLVERMEGTESNSFKTVDTLIRRFMYAEFKKDAGDIKIGKQTFNVRKILEGFLKYTGLNIMLGNVAIPATNLLVGELSMFKEAVGGNLLNLSDIRAGHALYKDAGLGAIQDFNEREKKSKYGRIFMYFNPLGTERPTDTIGINSSFMRRTLTHFFTGSLNSMMEYKLASETMGAVLNRHKAIDKDGKEISLYDAINVDMNGKVHLAEGYTYHGSNTLSDKDINDIRSYVLRIYQLTNNNSARLDSPGATEFMLGDLLFFMRRWLPEGMAARWKTKHYDTSLKQETEGHYVSALVAFNNALTQRGFMKGATDMIKIMTWLGKVDSELYLLPDELEKPDDVKEKLIELRKAGIRKTMFELYIIMGLTVAMAMLANSDDDSYALYMMARVRRELMTFMSPATAWDVLRSPTVAMNSIGGFHRILNDMGSSGWAFVNGDEQPVYQSGPGKGHNKLLFDIGRQSGLNWTNQFEDMARKTRLVSGGGWR